MSFLDQNTKHFSTNNWRKHEYNHYRWYRYRCYLTNECLKLSNLTKIMVEFDHESRIRPNSTFEFEKFEKSKFEKSKFEKSKFEKWIRTNSSDLIRDHFWSEQYFLRQLDHQLKLAWALSQTIITKFSVSKYLIHMVYSVIQLSRGWFLRIKGKRLLFNSWDSTQICWSLKPNH